MAILFINSQDSNYYQINIKVGLRCYMQLNLHIIGQFRKKYYALKKNLAKYTRYWFSGPIRLIIKNCVWPCTRLVAISSPSCAGDVQFNLIISPWRRVISCPTCGRVSFLNFNLLSFSLGSMHCRTGMKGYEGCDDYFRVSS